MSQALEHITAALAATPVADGIARLAGSRIFIYGAGNYGRIMQRLLTENGFPADDIAGFLDASPIGRVVGQHPVRHPEDPAIPRDLRQEVVVIISIYSSLNEHDRIAEQLHSWGYPNVRSCYDVAISFHTANDPATRLAGGGYLQKNLGNIVDGCAVWADQESIETYLRHFTGYARCDIRQFACETNHRQYFPPHLLHMGKPVRFIDCGAFDGDTVRDLIVHAGRAQALALFEPCEANFKALKSFVRANDGQLADQVFLYPCGVWDETTQLCFDGEAASASAVSSTGGVCIQCVALDDALHGFSPTFIKMDVEGAEPAALRGAEMMIRRHRPDLAISVYHALAHFWEIPRLIRQWVPEYRLYLRTYAAAGFETIMYATVADDDREMGR